MLLNMKNNIVLFSLFCGLAMSQGLYAQGTDEDPYKNVPSRLKKQQDDFNGGSYMFPAQKRSNWAIGVMAGGAFESSDVKATTGYGLGLNVQKALGHTFSLRGQLTGGVMTGQNYQYTKGYFSGETYGNPWANVRDAGDKYYWGGRTVSGNSRMPVYYNYRTNWYDMSIQGVANLNNINFYKEQNKFNLYATAGLGAMIYNTMVDALDPENNIYRFDTIKARLEPDRNLFNFGQSKSGVTETLYAMRGIKGVFGLLNANNYESTAEYHSDEQGIPLNIRMGKKLQYWDSNDRTMKTFGGADSRTRYYVWNPFINASAGVTYRITRRIDIGVEQRIAWTNDDLMDGQRWQENGAEPRFGNKAMTRDFDSYHFTAVIMNVRLGKGEESMWWVNPLAEMYGSVADTRKLVKSATEDTDNDGIPDLFDQEPDTPEGVTTDNYGRTLDSDEDGVPDHQDEQKFSPKNCEVDSRGVVKDGDADNVPDCFDIELNSKADCYVDAKGRCIEFPKMDCKDCEWKKDTIVIKTEVPVGGVVSNIAPCMLPSVHFDLDRYNVKQEFYPSLYAVARYMLDNPSVMVKVSGYTDTKNDAMIQKRIDACINFIAGNFGIDKSRFQTAMGADANGVGVYTGGKGSAKNPQHAPLDYINRRVDFSCM